MTTRRWAGLLGLLLAAGCGGGDTSTCANIGGATFTGTEILDGCGFSQRQNLVTYEFHQSKDSCEITVGTPLESCSGSIVDETVSWTCNPVSGVTYNQAHATLSSGDTILTGSFTWTKTGCGSQATTTFTLTKS
jgi:hypothetical protein